MRITIAAIAAPKGRGPGGVKDADGQWYNYWTDGQNALTLSKGLTYDVETYDSTRNGKTTTFIKSATQVAAAAAGPAQSNGRDNAMEESIFVTGVVGRAMGSGKYEPTQIKVLTLAAVEAYRAWRHGAGAPAHGPQQEPPGEPEQYSY